MGSARFALRSGKKSAPGTTRIFAPATAKTEIKDSLTRNRISGTAAGAMYPFGRAYMNSIGSDNAKAFCGRNRTPALHDRRVAVQIPNRLQGKNIFDIPSSRHANGASLLADCSCEMTSISWRKLQAVSSLSQSSARSADRRRERHPSVSAQFRVLSDREQVDGHGAAEF